MPSTSDGSPGSRRQTGSELLAHGRRTPGCTRRPRDCERPRVSRRRRADEYSDRSATADDSSSTQASDGRARWRELGVRQACRGRRRDRGNATSARSSIGKVNASRRSSCARDVMRRFYTPTEQPNIALEPSAPMKSRAPRLSALARQDTNPENEIKSRNRQTTYGCVAASIFVRP